MIYDCFTFYNEFELLDIRLNELKDVVDQFVICESDVTHPGNNKPLYLSDRIDEYKDFNITLLTYKGKTNPSTPWDNEIAQRNCLANGLVRCKDDDIIIVSDLDEIPNPHTIKGLLLGDEVQALEMIVSYYYLNNIVNNRWWHAKVFKYKHLSTKTMNDMRFSLYPSIVPRGGNHLSYIGDAKFIQNKLRSWCHTEIEVPDDEETIQKCLDDNVYFGDMNSTAGNVIPINEIEFFPRYVIENKEKFNHLIRVDNRQKEVSFSQLGNHGRLGNQLFQIAATYATAKRTNRKAVIPESWLYRDTFKLDNELYGKPRTISPTYSFMVPSSIYVNPPETGDIDMVGWFQSYKYFNEYRTEITDMFFPKIRRQNLDYCGIHVRRGDYLEGGSCYTLPMSYFIDILDRQHEENVIVFSDDITWCKQNLPSNYEFFSGNETESLFLLASCRRIIMSPSSFSWWAGYLSGHNNVHIPEYSVNGHRIPYKEMELTMDGWIEEKYNPEGEYNAD